MFTDPERSPNLIELASNLPRSCALVYRHFGQRQRLAIAEQLADICRKRDVVFLVGADQKLALEVNADGVHVPQRLIGEIPIIASTKQFRWITAAAHSSEAVKAAFFVGADAVVVSPVFTSLSKSAGRAMGYDRFSEIAKKNNGPIFALGGITEKNIESIHGICAGVALVSAGV